MSTDEKRPREWKAFVQDESLFGHENMTEAHIRALKINQPIITVREVLPGNQGIECGPYGTAGGTFTPKPGRSDTERLDWMIKTEYRIVEITKGIFYFKIGGGIFEAKSPRGAIDAAMDQERPTTLAQLPIHACDRAPDASATLTTNSKCPYCGGGIL
jgi:hypothetical protein